MGEAGRAVLAIVTSILGLSIVAVILSTRSNTTGVIATAGTALSQVIGAATAPVTGSAGFAVGSTIGGVAAGLANPFPMGGSYGYGGTGFP